MIRHLSGMLVLAAVPCLQAQAFNKELFFELEAEYNSNINQAEDQAENKRSNRAYRLGTELKLNNQGARSDLDASLSVQYEQNDAVDDRTLYEGYTTFNYQLLPRRLSWTLEDVALQSRIDPRRPSSVSNTTNTNTFSTGPNGTIRISGRNTLDLSYRFERIDYDDYNEPDPTDSESTRATSTDRKSTRTTALFTHAFSRHLNGGLSFQQLREREEVADREPHIVDTQKIFSDRRTTRSHMALTAGTSKVKGVGGSANVGSFDFNYLLNPGWSFYVNYSKAVTTDIDSTLSFIRGRLQDISFVAQRCLAQSAISGVGSDCVDLRGVSTQQNVQDDWVLNREGIGAGLDPEILSLTYTGTFNFDDAIFDSINYRVGSLWQVYPAVIELQARVSEDEQFLENPTLEGTLNTPDKVDAKALTLALTYPFSPRWISDLTLSAVHTESDNGLLFSQVDEYSSSLGLSVYLNRDLVLSQTIQYLGSDTEDSIDEETNLSTAEGFSVILNLKWRI